MKTRISLAAGLMLLAMGLLSAQPKAKPVAESKSTILEWFGHGYFKITSSTGIKIAIDPFDPTRVTYPLPKQIVADVVLVTHESNDGNAVEYVQGNPQVYRSTTGVGTNMGGGVRFEGTRSFQDLNRGFIGGRNVVFSFKLDGLRFVALGALGHSFNSDEAATVGKADVLIAPVGLGLLPQKELMEIIKTLEAKVVIPCAFASEHTQGKKLLEQETYLQGLGNIRRFDASALRLTPETMPSQTEFWVLKKP